MNRRVKLLENYISKVPLSYSFLKIRSSGPGQSQLAQPELLINKRHRGTKAQRHKVTVRQSSVKVFKYTQCNHVILLSVFLKLCAFVPLCLMTSLL
jgi:hypothetical protein